MTEVGEGTMDAAPNPLVSIVIESTDLGDNPEEIREFIVPWLESVVEGAPFHVEGAGFKIEVAVERIDV